MDYTRRELDGQDLTHSVTVHLSRRFITAAENVTTETAIEVVRSLTDVHPGDIYGNNPWTKSLSARIEHSDGHTYRVSIDHYGQPAVTRLTSHD
jgi:hypothetical protein